MFQTRDSRKAGDSRRTADETAVSVLIPVAVEAPYTYRAPDDLPLRKREERAERVERDPAVLLDLLLGALER